MISPVLSVEGSVEVWTLPLTRLSSLPVVECATLLSSIGLAVEERGNCLTLMNTKRLCLVQSSLNKASFVALPIVDPILDILNLKHISFLSLFASLSYGNDE